MTWLLYPARYMLRMGGLGGGGGGSGGGGAAGAKSMLGGWICVALSQALFRPLHEPNSMQCIDGHSG